MSDSLPVMHSAKPLSVPAAVYDKLWVKELIVSCPTIGGDAEARVFLQRFRTVGDGAEEAPEAPTVMTVPGILSAASSDPDMAEAVAAIMRYVLKEAASQGIAATDHPDPSVPD